MTANELLDELKKSTTVSYENDILTQKYGILSTKINSIMKSSKEAFLKELLIKPIYKVLNENELRILNNVHIDIIPSFKANARIIKADDGEYLVIINERLMALFFSWYELQMKAALELIPDNDTQDFAKSFSPVLECYLTRNSNSALPTFTFEELSFEYQYIALMQTISCEQFVLAHELAHVYLGHLKQVNCLNMINDEFWATFPAQNESQQMEFDADIQAIKWLVSLTKDEKNHIFFFIDAFTVFHYIECNEGFPTAESSHPSTISRLINIREYFGSDIFSNDDYCIDDMIENFKDITNFRIKI